RLAQLVQSTCLTSRGSLVRIQQCPRNEGLDFSSPFLISQTMYFFYILYSSSADKYYIGHTSNLEERIKKHNTIHSGFTGKKNDWEIVYSETFDTKEKAYARERQVKGWKNRKRIRKSIWFSKEKLI